MFVWHLQMFFAFCTNFIFDVSKLLDCYLCHLVLSYLSKCICLFLVDFHWGWIFENGHRGSECATCSQQRSRHMGWWTETYPNPVYCNPTHDLEIVSLDEQCNDKDKSQEDNLEDNHPQLIHILIYSATTQSISLKLFGTRRWPCLLSNLKQTLFQKMPETEKMGGCAVPNLVVSKFHCPVSTQNTHIWSEYWMYKV